MRYMGSKAKIAKYILPIVLKNRKMNQWYVEPMVGGCNMMELVSGNRIGADANEYLIAMWKGLQQGKEYPKYIDKNLYDFCREQFHQHTGNKGLIGWVGFMASVKGRFYDGGYSGHKVFTASTGKYRDYITPVINATLQQVPFIRDVNFVWSDYENLKIPENSVIYLDPPYANTKEYSTESFDSESFWEWAKVKSLAGHQVFISEYDAPDDFVPVWSKKVKNSMGNFNTKEVYEKLFVYKDCLKKLDLKEDYSFMIEEKIDELF